MVFNRRRLIHLNERVIATYSHFMARTHREIFKISLMSIGLNVVTTALSDVNRLEHLMVELDLDTQMNRNPDRIRHYSIVILENCEELYEVILFVKRSLHRIELLSDNPAEYNMEVERMNKLAEDSTTFIGEVRADYAEHDIDEFTLS